MKKLNKLPDAINASNNIQQSQIPTELIRTNKLTTKAKSVLFILLSNSKGWQSHFVTILDMMKERKSVLQSALVELEENKFLIRVQLRDKQLKQLSSSIWIYTDKAGNFNFDEVINRVDKAGFYFDKKAVTRFSVNGFSVNGKTASKIKKEEKKNKKKRKEEVFVTNAPHVVTNNNKIKYVTPQLFDKFWLLYPKRKNSTKAKALKAWDKLCKLPIKERPEWKIIKKAVKAQSKSERWTTQPDYIPHHSTWLNDHQWLNAPESLGVIEDYNKPKKLKNTYNSGNYKLTKESIKI